MDDSVYPTPINGMIDGFRVIRALGSKSPASTLLVRRSDGSEAAVLKFTPQGSIEKDVLQQIDHPGICQLLKAKTLDGHSYLLLSYYGQQTLMDWVEQGIAISELTQFFLQIAGALDALHQQGYAHGDLRPEHVLIKSNGQPVLIDLGSAYRTGENDTPLSPDQSGSPAYLSPERIQAASSTMVHQETASSGASDYYALGVIAFQLLSGRLPFSDESREAVLQAHLQESVPKLPSHLQTLQPVVDGLMAKSPQQRISNAAALKALFAAAELDAELAGHVVRSAAIDTLELSALFAELRLRPDELALRNKRLRRKRRRRIALQSTVALIFTGSILAGLFTFRAELLPVVENAAASLGIIENPELTAAWREAQSLASDPNQGLTTIVAAYRRVIELAPGYQPAQQALRDTAVTWKQSIAGAMAQNDLERATTRLEEAQSVFESDPELTVLSLRLQNRFRAERLLASTQSLLRSSGLSDEASAAAAVQAFEEILRISPDHAAAAQGLTDISKHYGELAAQAAREGEVAQAIRLLQRATAARSDLRELDQVRRLISEATSIQSAIADLLAQAQVLRQQGQLILPSGANAAELYLQVLATDPDNAPASAGLGEITAAVMEEIQDLVKEGALTEAQQQVALAESQGLNPTPIANMRERIDSEITRRSQISIGLEQANVLIEQGFITAPAENNAVRKLQEVLALDATNEQALFQITECAKRLASVAEQARKAGMNAEARDYLAQALGLRPDVEEWQRRLKKWQTDS
jgi:serine/threonine protein kinase